MTPRRLALIMSFNNKPDRERVSGVLRFAAHQPDWDVRIFDSSSEQFRTDCRQNLADNWHPDACLYSNKRAFLEVTKGFSARKTNPIRVEIDTEPGPNTPAIRVTLDNHALISAAVNLLLRRGYTNVAHFGTTEPTEGYYSETQRGFFTDLADERKIPSSTFRFDRQEGTNQALRDAAKWIIHLPKPCGIIAYSDKCARDLLDACRLAQISVPEQVAIIGIDNDTELCESARPTLSSIQPDFESSGYRAAEALNRLWSSPETTPRQQLLSYGIKDIHERASTQDLRGCGRIAAAAQSLLQKEAMTSITVREIAKRLNLSTRLLEINYRKINGRTVKSDLTETRLRKLRERLQSESLPLGELALACGFKTVNAAQVAFRKRFGFSMRQQRKIPK